MRVLLLPHNISSQIQITVKALRAIGVDARGLIGEGSFHFTSDDLDVCPYPGRRRFTPAWFTEHSRYYLTFLRAIAWADIVHYHFGGAFGLPRSLDVSWASMLGKPRLIMFWGSDVRIPEVEAVDNPYYERVNRDPRSERFGVSSRQKSVRVQRFYADRGFTCTLGGETMIPHVEAAGVFRHYHLVRCLIDLKETVPRYPDPTHRRVTLVHNPSIPFVKGTPAVTAAVDALRRRGLDVELVLNQRRPRAEVLDSLGQADVYLDQFVIGGGYGMAGIEAMAMGKPVVSYITNKYARLFPPGLPVVNASPDTLTDVLAELVVDGRRRHALGRQGRAFVEKYHDAETNARQLVAIYEDLLRTRGRRMPAR